MKLLGQQPSHARAHACTTTTCTSAHLSGIAEIQHIEVNTRLAQPVRQVTPPVRSDEYYQSYESEISLADRRPPQPKHQPRRHGVGNGIGCAIDRAFP